MAKQRTTLLENWRTFKERAASIGLVVNVEKTQLPYNKRTEKDNRGMNESGLTPRFYNDNFTWTYLSVEIQTSSQNISRASWKSLLTRLHAFGIQNSPCTSHAKSVSWHITSRGYSAPPGDSKGTGLHQGTPPRSPERRPECPPVPPVPIRRPEHVDLERLGRDEVEERAETEGV